MHLNDTLNADGDTVATTATRYDYSMALVRAIATFLAEDDTRPPQGRKADTFARPKPVTHVSVYVPHWLEAGEPWTLARHPKSPEWVVCRPATEHPTSGAVQPGAVFRFGDNIRECAAAMLAFDQVHPFLLVDSCVWHPTEAGIQAISEAK